MVVLHSALLSGRSFITTPIFYVNAAPHIGHLYSAVLADAAHRWQLARGNVNSVFSTGTDEHGLKVQQAAQRAGVSPMQLCDRVSGKFKSLFDTANVSYTNYIRTTEDRHTHVVQDVWNTLSKQKLIYKDSYEGWYCVSDETFVSDVLVNDGPNAGTKISIESGNIVEWSSEVNYMFRLSAFQQQLLDWVESTTPPVIIPDSAHRLVVGWLSQPLYDLSISRPSSRLSWGIPVPGDNSQMAQKCLCRIGSVGHCALTASVYQCSSLDFKSKWCIGCGQQIYVWLDALVNYLTVSGYPNSDHFWPASAHIVGKIFKFFRMLVKNNLLDKNWKLGELSNEDLGSISWAAARGLQQEINPEDILKFHSIYWPAFLMGMGLPPPRRIVCHSHWTMDSMKMSKSKGNVVDPFDQLNRFGVEPVRYFLLKEGTLHQDKDYSEDRVVDLFNADIANNYGNLLQRVLSPNLRPYGVKICINPDLIPLNSPGEGREEDLELVELLCHLPEVVWSNYEDYRFGQGIQAVLNCLQMTNQFITRHQPWQLVKDPSHHCLLGTVLAVAMESLRLCSLHLMPVLPLTSSHALRRLGSSYGYATPQDYECWLTEEYLHKCAKPHLPTNSLPPLVQKLKL